MPSLSDHTKIINLLIALGHRTPDLPHSLEDIGYTLDYIGVQATLPFGTICPDVTFKSYEKNNLLMFEAKSGSVDNEQAERYSKAKPDDLSKQGITSLPAPKLKFELGYVCTSSNKQKLEENERQFRWGFPILVFEDHILRRNGKYAKFKERKLDLLFSKGVPFNRTPSYEIFPFGESDSKNWIAFCLLSQMAQFAAVGKTRFTEKELVNACHPLFEYFWRDEKESIYRITRATMNKLNEMGTQKIIIKKHANNEWELLKFDFKKSTAKLLMDVADSVPDTVDIAKFLSGNESAN